MYSLTYKVYKQCPVEPHYDFDDFTTHDRTSFTTSRPVFDLYSVETLPFCDFSSIHIYSAKIRKSHSRKHSF